MDKHIVDKHKSEKKFKCKDCDQSFVSELRLRKHCEMHTSRKNIKYCHYFNNGLDCPFQRFGCKFRHANSPSCKFQENCRVKKCQFKHEKEPCIIPSNTENELETETLVQNENLDNSSENDESFNSDDDSSEEDEEDVKLNKAAVNKFCEHYCQSTSRFHIHSKNDIQMFYGLDLKKTIAKFEEGKFTRVFQCDSCEHKTSEFKIHEEHYSSSHKNEEKFFHCIFDNCEYQTNDPEEMINHMKHQHAEDMLY